MQGKWRHSNCTPKKAKSIKCDNNKQQKNTQLLAAGRNELGEHSAKCYTKRVHQPFRPPPPYPFTYHFWQKRFPFGIPSIDKWHPSNCRKCSLFCRSWINPWARRYLCLFNSHKMHLLFISNITLPCNVLLLEKSPSIHIPEAWKKNTPFGRKPWKLSI